MNSTTTTTRIDPETLPRNFDCATDTDLENFIIEVRTRPFAVSRALFPNELHFYRMRAVQDLELYAALSLAARRDRRDGLINAATASERSMENIYARLPTWAQW